MKTPLANTPYKTYSPITEHTLPTSPSVQSIPNHDTKAIRAIVQEMIKKRREKRNGALNGIKTLNVMKEGIYNVPLKTTGSIKEMFKNTEDDLSGDIAFIKGGFETITPRRNPMPVVNRKYNRTLKKSRQNVYERLYANNGRKTSVRRSEERSTNLINARFRKPRHNNSVKVEDRLLEFKRKSESKLMRKRADALRAELENVQQLPKILPRSQSSSYGSLLGRFEALEKEKQRKLIRRTEEAVLEELSHVRKSPDINERSRKMIRGVKKMLEWEYRKKQKLELIRRKRKAKEMEELIENRSMTMIAPGTKKYLIKISREPSIERVEEILIRYGLNAKAKAKDQYETPKYSFKPTINGLEYKHTLYAPFSPYSQFVNTQISVEIPKDRQLEEKESMCKSARTSKIKLIKDLCKSTKNKSINDSHPKHYKELEKDSQ